MKKLILATLSIIMSVSLCDAQDASAELAKSKIGKEVSKVKLQLVDGTGFKEAKLTAAPEYYILYFSASW